MTTTKKPKFTKAETQSILERLESGQALAHELAYEYECGPADIFWLWDERNRAR